LFRLHVIEIVQLSEWTSGRSELAHLTNDLRTLEFEKLRTQFTEFNGT